LVHALFVYPYGNLLCYKDKAVSHKTLAYYIQPLLFCQIRRMSFYGLILPFS